MMVLGPRSGTLLGTPGLTSVCLTGSAPSEKAIREYIDAPHDNPKPFVWTKTAHEILASIARLHSAP